MLVAPSQIVPPSRRTVDALLPCIDSEEVLATGSSLAGLLLQL